MAKCAGLAATAIHSGNDKILCFPSCFCLVVSICIAMGFVNEYVNSSKRLQSTASVGQRAITQ